jgi:hypothetical protein
MICNSGLLIATSSSTCTSSGFGDGRIVASAVSEKWLLGLPARSIFNLFVGLFSSLDRDCKFSSDIILYAKWEEGRACGTSGCAGFCLDEKGKEVVGSVAVVVAIKSRYRRNSKAVEEEEREVRMVAKVTNVCSDHGMMT